MPLACAAALAGCGVAPEVPAGKPQVSAAAGPGAELVPASQATKLFTQVCARTEPSFSAAPARLGGAYAQNVSTGTYFHQQLNLSFKINANGQNGCSMVFRSGDASAAVRASLGRIDPEPRVSSFADGYFRAVLPAE